MTTDGADAATGGNAQHLFAVGDAGVNLPNSRWGVQAREFLAQQKAQNAEPPCESEDVCSHCHGSGWDNTWHEGAACAEIHPCGFCRGGTYSGRPLHASSSQSATTTDEPASSLADPKGHPKP